MFRNSIDKIVKYIDELDKEILFFSSCFLRDLKCHLSCGACCIKFTLDYLDNTDRWEKFKKTYPDKLHLFKQREYAGATYWSYVQEENKDY